MDRGKGKMVLPTAYVLTVGILVLAILWGSRAVTVISESLPPEREHCIIIDAGHGGVDGGATSCSGKLESEFNLEIALRLNDLLHLLGYDTGMIRTTDVSVYTKGETIAQQKISDLKERVRIVNETEHALLVSIHQNTFPDERYRGAQVFYGGNGDSEVLAKQLQAAFTSTLNAGSKRQCKRAEGVYLMEHIECTGVLVECGFLSNPEEEAFLKDPGYQKKLCCVIAATLCSYLSNT